MSHTVQEADSLSRTVRKGKILETKASESLRVLWELPSFFGHTVPLRVDAPKCMIVKAHLLSLLQQRANRLA